MADGNWLTPRQVNVLCHVRQRLKYLRQETTDDEHLSDMDVDDINARLMIYQVKLDNYSTTYWQISYSHTSMALYEQQMVWSFICDIIIRENKQEG